MLEWQYTTVKTAETYPYDAINNNNNTNLHIIAMQAI